MATINAATYKARIYQGATGNASIAHGQANLKAAAADTVVNMLEVPMGLMLVGVRVATQGLGAGVKATIKLGDEVLAADVDVANKGAQAIACVPVETMEQKTPLTVTLTGGAATGELHVMPEYLALGTI